MSDGAIPKTSSRVPMPTGLPPVYTPRLWRHKERGTVYVELARGTLQTGEAAALDNAEVVIYRVEGGSAVWVRPAREFADGRFEAL